MKKIFLGCFLFFVVLLTQCDFNFSKQVKPSPSKNEFIDFVVTTNQNKTIKLFSIKFDNEALKKSETTSDFLLTNVVVKISDQKHTMNLKTLFEKLSTNNKNE